jgi:transposase
MTNGARSAEGMQYTDTIKARMVRRMVGPGGITTRALAAETGISQSALSKWLRQARRVTGEMADNKDDHDGEPPRARRPRDWSADEKLRALAETTDLEGEALGGYLRRNGLRAEDLQQWRADARGALEQPEASRRRSSAEAKRIRDLDRELRKKDRALAETAALLVLRKKANALWGDGDDDTDERNEP